MKRLAISALLVVILALPGLAQSLQKMLVVARDTEDRPLEGFRFTYEGSTSLPTTGAGATELTLPAAHGAGKKIKILLQSTPEGEGDWFLMDPMVNVPLPSTSAEVVLMQRMKYQALAAEVLELARQAPLVGVDAAEASRAQDLHRVAARYGLAPSRFEAAIRAFSETGEPTDRGVAAFLSGQYDLAENLLSQVVDRKAEELVKTLRFLGAAQYQQGKYRDAEGVFRRALAVKPEDPCLLGWLGQTLQALADWQEAEALLRRALSIDEAIYRPGLPRVAISLNSLAQLLQATNRLSEAEPMMRRALSIVEDFYGPEHPNVATPLANLASLLQSTNRHAEAEPMIRRALAINERTYGPNHPRVAIPLNNLARLLHDRRRLSEAEPLMRRALSIDEAWYGRGHPTVAIRLSNLAAMLQDANQLSESEAMFRRALEITEATYGPDHPEVGIDLVNLAALLEDKNHLKEAESLIRRALSIHEVSHGQDHPTVAIDLNALARVLQASNRLAEAEPLLRRALTIFLDFKCRTDHEHPRLEVCRRSYRALLVKMGRSEEEIEATMRELEAGVAPTPQ